MAFHIQDEQKNVNQTDDQIAEQYRQLLGGPLSDGNLSQEVTKKVDKNLRWTRVLTREHFAISGILESNLDEDITEAWDEINSIKPDRQIIWEPLFNPKDLEHAELSKDPEDYRLADQELEELGKQVARLRYHVQLRVDAIKSVGDAVDVGALPPQMVQPHYRDKWKRLRRRMEEGQEAQLESTERGLSHKYRRRKLHELSTEEILSIGHAKLIEERTRRDIAEEFRVSIGLVSRVTSKCKNGLQFIEEREARSHTTAQQVAQVRQAVQMIMSSKGRITNVAEVQRAINDQYSINLTSKLVRKIMISELGLKFRPLKTFNPRANCNAALIQRQQFAIALIGAMMEGKRIINIDESAIGQGVFIRKGWSFSGSSAGHSVKPFGHRLSLLSAVDTDGQIYFAISQSTTDQRVFGTFLCRLTQILDYEEPQWREYTIIMLDGASYHIRSDAMKAMAALRIPVMFAGPYAYDGSPAEKLFAHLKAGDLNPEGIKTGKRQVQEILITVNSNLRQAAELIGTRLQQLNKDRLAGIWRVALLNIYRYAGLLKI